MNSKQRLFTRNRLWKWTLFLAGLFGALPIVVAQETDSDDEVFELSPFVVDTTQDSGYYAAQTLAGGRTATEIINTGTSIEVLTPEMLEDLGSTNVEDFLQYTTGGEVGGSQGNFVGADTSSQFGYADSSAGRREPHTNTRLRGIGNPDYVRNYYKTNIPMDGYNTERVDINRGANSFLFGLGSPAGLINFGYARAMMNDFNELEFRIGQGGDSPSSRFALTMNKELIEDKLAIRFSGLVDQKRYRQEPSYRDDDRVYGAVTFKPFKNTTIRAHVETGDIMGNAPDTLLPAQAFDTFIEQRTPVDIYYNIQHFGDPEGPTQAEWDAMSAADQQRFIPQGRGGNLLLSNGSMWGWAMVYDGANGGQPSFGFRPSIANNLYEKNGTDPGDPFWDPAVLADGTPGGMTDGAPTMMFWRNQRYRTELGGIGPAQGFTTLDGFDFSKQNFAGDNDFYSHEFTTYNLTLEQLFFDGNLGFEFGYDYEEKDNDALTNFNGWQGEFLIDINETLPLPALNPDGSFKRDVNGEVVAEVMPNPNFGRPFYNTEPSRSISFEERETLRATAFAKYNFSDRHENSILKWLGNHTLTALGDKFTDKYRTANVRQQSFSDDRNLAWHLGRQNGDLPSDGYRRLSKMVYFGPPIQSYINDAFNPATPINLNDIRINAASADLMLDNPTTGMTFWNLGPDAEGSRWYHSSFPGFEQYFQGVDEVNNHRPTQSGNDFVNEGTEYVGDTREYWDRATLEGRWEPIDNRIRKMTIESWAINLQSMFFNDHLVLNTGYREDYVEQWLNSVPQEKQDLFMAGILPESYLGDRSFAIGPEFFKPEDGQYSKVDKGPTGEGSFGYGGVLHIPRNLIAAKLPEWLNVSVHYNYSKNFVPDTSRTTFVPGEDWSYEALPSPIGEGEDIGFTLRFNDNKFVARFNWFESTIQNNSAGLGNTLNQLVNWAIRGRAWADQDLRDMDPDGNGIIDVRADGSPHPRAGNPRYDLSRLHDVFDATQFAVDDGWIDGKIENGFLEYNANGSQKRQVWFPDLEDTEERTSKGFEVNLTYNPTRNWRISMNATNIESVSSNVGPLTSHLMNNFFEKYNVIKGYVLWEAADTNPTNSPFSRWFEPHVLTYYQKKLQEGSATQETRDWYVNAVTNYNFTEGRLSGFSIGGAVRYQSAGSIGYPLMNYEVSPGVFLNVPDVSKSYMGADNWNVDVNVGYKKRILGGDVDWSCRLHFKNINNYGSDKLTTVRANFDGTPATVRWDPPLEIFLTNTFKF